MSKTDGALVWPGLVAPAEQSESIKGLDRAYEETVQLLLADGRQLLTLVDPEEHLNLVENDYVSMVHDEEYVSLADDNYECERAWEGENPALATRAGITFYSSVVGAALIAKKLFKFVYVVSGGRHHPKSDEGSKGDPFNDVAGAAVYFSEQGMRPLIIDLGISPASGTQNILWNKNIPTVSVHSGFTEAKNSNTQDLAKRGHRHTFHWHENHAYNFVIENNGNDDALAWALSGIEPLVRKYQPDVIIYVCGSSGEAFHKSFVTKPVAPAFTAYGYEMAARRVKNWSEEFCEGRILMMSGGDYPLQNNSKRVWVRAAQIFANPGQLDPIESLLGTSEN
jgi:acetoin utilization deacetylase AcuC-like enzyme